MKKIVIYLTLVFIVTLSACNSMPSEKQLQTWTCDFCNQEYDYSEHVYADLSGSDPNLNNNPAPGQFIEYYTICKKCATEYWGENRYPYEVWFCEACGTILGPNDHRNITVTYDKSGICDHCYEQRYN